MSSHDEVRQQLALSAAGLLDATEERRLREHLRDCVECAALAGEFADLAAGLESLPAPVPPFDLATRTEALLRAEVAREADRRQGALLAGAACLLAWMMMLASWYGYQLWAGGGALTWLVWWVCSVPMTAAAAGVVASRRRSERRFS